MQNTLSRADGLHILSEATLSQLAQDEALRIFADGLIPQAIANLDQIENRQLTMAKLLHQVNLIPVNALLTVLMVLDAEIKVIVDEKMRTFPISAFLSYRSRFPLESYPLSTVRLPPLSPDGHYIFSVIKANHYLALRLDVHPKQKVGGHIRIAIGSPVQPAQRIQATEHRLERQKLTSLLVEAAVEEGNKELSISLAEAERAHLAALLKGLGVD